MKPIARFLLFLPIVVVFTACARQNHAPVPPGATVLVLGDSISYGTGAGIGEDYPTILAGKTGWHIVNAGVPGDTTAGGLERLPGLLAEHAPRLVLVELGGNDFLRRVPLEQTASNLGAILSQIKAKNIPAVLVAMPRPNLLGAAVGGLSDDPIYERIAEETGTPLVPDVLSEVLSKSALRSDPIHPNAEGYRQMGEGMRRALEEMGFVK